MIAILLAVALQDPGKVEALEKRVVELEKKVETLEAALRTLNAGLPPLQQATARAITRAKEASCANNLRQLWTLQYTYSVQFGGKMKKMPEWTGHHFWIALSKTVPPLVDETELDVYVCPLSAEKARADFTSYRGPSKLIPELKGGDPVGCCVHPDGTVNVLYKSGDVKTLGPDDPAAKAAVEGTQGPPKK